MRVLVLGAGKDVGRSCVVVRLGCKTFMFDCGMHMGYHDARRFPDFSLLSPSNDFNSVIDAVFVTHFHLDHVGALPFFTEVCGYQGPIYMTYPTRAIAPLMLEDYHKVLMDRPGTGPVFSRQHITACMGKVKVMDLQETVKVCEGCEATAYYAGHVLGAAILHVRVGGESIVYTGDFNTVPDRHLAGACIGRLAPDLLITESTYATSLRQGKRAREAQLMAMVHEAVSSGGKVLVPVFAVGRAQELLLLLDEFWDRTQLSVPIYFSGAMAARASQYYRLLMNWASERVKQGPSGTRSDAFGFKRVLTWQPDFINQPGPCVLFATPGMLHGGTSLEVFKAWAAQHNNLVLLPSYQVAGTLGRRLMLGQRKGIQVDASTKLDVNCKVHYVPFSAHADSKGILQLVQQVAPSAVMLVHGEPDKMAFMSDKIQRSLGIQCFAPANGEEIQLGSQNWVPVSTSAQLLRKLPMSLQQLQQQQGIVGPVGRPGIGSSTPAGAAAANVSIGGEQGMGTSAGAAAATCLQWQDVGQLVQSAMKLAGLGQPLRADAGAAVDASGQTAGQLGAAHHHHQQQQQPPTGQQQEQQVSAAARAAQLAPWLELLAAAAQDSQKGHSIGKHEQQQAQHRQQQGQIELQHHPPANRPQQRVELFDARSEPEQQYHQPMQHEQQGPDQDRRQQQQHYQQDQVKQALPASVAQLSQQLKQQLVLEQQGTVLDGLLVVRHLQPEFPAKQPLVRSMQLLPAQAAGAALGLPQHQMKLKSSITLPAICWTGQHQASSKLQPESTHNNTHGDHTKDAAQQQSKHKLQALGGDTSAVASAVGFVAAALSQGLPSAVAQQLHASMDGCQLQLRSVLVQSAEVGKTLMFSWQLQDNPLAQQCLSLVHAAVVAVGCMQDSASYS